jgi:hypothetical protein
MARIHWDDLKVIDSDENTIKGEDRIAALRDFKATGTMDGLFFEFGGAAHENREDASTWGPKSPAAVDWTGFPEQTYSVVRYDSAGGLSAEEVIATGLTLAEATKKADKGHGKWWDPESGETCYHESAAEGCGGFAVRPE